VTTSEFIRLSERISGQQLDGLFQTWLYTPGRPELPGGERALEERGSGKRPAGVDALISTMKGEAALR
jgi:hypothetical protein